MEFKIIRDIRDKEKRYKVVYEVFSVRSTGVPKSVGCTISCQRRKYDILYNDDAKRISIDFFVPVDYAKKYAEKYHQHYKYVACHLAFDLDETFTHKGVFGETTICPADILRLYDEVFLNSWDNEEGRYNILGKERKLYQLVRDFTDSIVFGVPLMQYLEHRKVRKFFNETLAQNEKKQK